MIPKEDLLKRIRTLMKITGVSERMLAEHLELSQSGISKILHSRRRLSYEDAQLIIGYLLSKNSLIPHHIKAEELATPLNEIKWAHIDEFLSIIAERMFKEGLSQLPVRDIESGVCKGVITELALLRGLVGSQQKVRTFKNIEEIGQSSVMLSGMMETVPIYSADSYIVELAQVLLENPAILIETNGNVTGIITRSDILKLLFDYKKP
jgi:predicted transcriptional regulator